MNDYLQLTSSAFGTVSESGYSWFAISNVSFSTVYSSSTGHESFGALSFTIDPSALTATLLAIEGPGQSGYSAEIVGYGLVSGQESLFQLDMFKDAYVSALTMNADGTETVSLTYGDLHEQTYNGSSTTAVAKAGWNAVTRAQDSSTITAPARFSQVQTAPGIVPPLTYYVQFRDTSGTALTSPDGKSWFAVTAVGFGSTASFNATNSSTFAFGGVSFTLAPGQALPTLFLDQAQGTVFGQVELAGYESGGAAPELVQDTVFKTATFTTMAAGSDGSVAVTMAYAAQVDTDYTYAPNGTSVTTTDGWNGPNGIADDTATIAASATKLPAADAGFAADVACFCAGTGIRTGRGAVKVEELAIGDSVATLHAGLQKVKWIGWRSYDGRFIAGNKDVLPICIKRHAIDENVPARDLFVSPGHAICIDGALIHAFRLVNGVSVTQAASVETVTYYHIETEGHEVIFAENCPAETFIGEAFRGQFQNAADYRALYPEQSAAGIACLPHLEDGFSLHAIQQRLNLRAGLLLRPETEGALRGYVDVPGPDVCSGWAQDLENPETPVRLDIMIDGTRVARVLANCYRADLRHAGVGSGCHAFRAALPAGCAGQVQVRRATDAAELRWTDEALALAA
jgi:type VI protein secretion system component Hcp